MTSPLPRQGEVLQGTHRSWVVSAVSWPDLDPPAALLRCEIVLDTEIALLYAAAYFTDPDLPEVQSLARLTGVATTPLLDRSTEGASQPWVALADDTATWRHQPRLDVFPKDEVLLALEVDDLGWVPDRHLARSVGVRYVKPSIRNAYAPPSPATRHPEPPGVFLPWMIRMVVSDHAEARDEVLLGEPAGPEGVGVLDCSGHHSHCQRVAERLQQLAGSSPLHAIGSKIRVLVDRASRHALDMAAAIDGVGIRVDSERSAGQRLGVRGTCRCHRHRGGVSGPSLAVALASSASPLPVSSIEGLAVKCTPFGLLCIADCLKLLAALDPGLASAALAATDAAPLLAEWQPVRVGARTGRQVSIVPLAVALGLCATFRAQIGTDSLFSDSLVAYVLHDLAANETLGLDAPPDAVLRRFLDAGSVLSPGLLGMLRMAGTQR